MKIWPPFSVLAVSLGAVGCSPEIVNMAGISEAGTLKPVAAEPTVSNNHPVGTWGAVLPELQVTSGYERERYESSYQELRFSAKGSYLWSGWARGKKFQKSGVWHWEGYRIVMEDKEMHLSDSSIKKLVWDDKSYATLTKLDNGYYQLGPTGIGGTRMFWLGVQYDLAKKGYYDQTGKRLEFDAASSDQGSQPTGAGSTPVTTSPPPAAAHGGHEIAKDVAGIGEINGAKIQQALNLVGQDRQKLIDLLGMPSSTEFAEAGEGARWRWSTPVNSIPGLRAIDAVRAESSNATKKVDRVEISYDYSVRVEQVLPLLDWPKRKVFCAEEEYAYNESNFLPYLIEAPGNQGQQVHLYATASSPVMLLEPYIDDKGMKSQRCRPNPSFDALQGKVYRAVAGVDERGFMYQQRLK